MYLLELYYPPLLHIGWSTWLWLLVAMVEAMTKIQGKAMVSVVVIRSHLTRDHVTVHIVGVTIMCLRNTDSSLAYLMGHNWFL